jgi:N-acetylglucosamine kinase-like BadF-type ATPase
LPFYLGVDGGQSSTVALIGDENGVVVGYGVSGPSNHVQGPGGREKLRRAVLGSVSAAWESSPYSGAGKHLPQFESAFFGMAGGPQDKVEILGELIDARRLEVSNDAITALIGATEGQPGIIVIAGTGSIAFGINAQGQTARAGGWGYVFGDEGSAFGLARDALRAALRFEEGWGPATELRDRIVRFSEARDLDEALHKWYTLDFPRPRVASFSREIDEAAQAGDRLAREILRHGAAQLAELVEHVRSRIFTPEEAVLVSHTGGVWKSKIVRERFRNIVEEAGNNRVIAPALDPSAGALLAAYRNAGITEIKLKNLPLAK